MKARPLRVWLEPDYDYGRFGGWLLDLPGAFLWASSQDRVVSQAPAAAGWYRDWLERHGEDVAMVFGPTEVVEAVKALPDVGYERNATFVDDARPVAADELEAAIRRLGFARGTCWSCSTGSRPSPARPAPSRQPPCARPGRRRR